MPEPPLDGKGADPMTEGDRGEGRGQAAQQNRKQSGLPGTLSYEGRVCYGQLSRPVDSNQTDSQMLVHTGGVDSLVQNHREKPQRGETRHKDDLAGKPGLSSLQTALKLTVAAEGMGSPK